MNIYIKGKKSFAEKIGAKIIHMKKEENISETELIEIINGYNNDKTVRVDRHIHH